MRNIAVVTARSGSKGLPDKNIKALNGKPLLWYSIEAARQSGCFDTIMVSTDSEQYRDIALQCGAEVPFLRSKENAGAQASSWEAVREVLQGYTNMGQSFDTVALLQPTSPLRTARHIAEGYALMEQKEANAVVGVVQTEHSPLWSNTLPDDGNMEGFIRPECLNLPRQALPVYYRINGALYIARTELIRENCDIYRDRCFAYVMPQQASVDIDTEYDFCMAEFMMRQQAHCDAV